MKQRRILQKGVVALAVAGLLGSAQLAFVGQASASGYRHHGHHGASYSYSYGGHRPYYGSRHGYYHRSYRHRYGHHRPRYRHHGHGGVSVGVHGHGSDGAAVAGALGAGVLLGYLLTRPPAVVSKPVHHASPNFGYGKRVQRDCKPTTGRGLHQGRQASFGGTFCYDSVGRGYIVPGSEYLIGYVN